MAIPQIVANDLLNFDCPPLIASLADAACNNPVTKRTRTSLIGREGFYRSPMNRDFLQDLIINRDRAGKVRSATLSYLQRDCPGAGEDCSTVDVCALPAVDPYLTETVEFNSPVCVVKRLRLDRSEYEKTCIGQDTGFADRLNKSINALLLDFEAALFVQLLAGVGGNAANPALPVGDSEVIPTFINDAGLVNANALHKLIEDLLINEAEECEIAAFFGLRNPLAKMELIRELGCCNDSGIDQSRAADILNGVGIAPYKSKTVDSAFTADGALTPSEEVLLMHPGASHLIEYFRYDGDLAYKHGESFAQVYTDPFSGEKFDMKVHFDDCVSGGGEAYVVTLWKQAQIWTMPTTIYNTCDDLENVNGIWRYSLDICPPATC